MTLRTKLLVLVAGVALFAATGVTTVALWRQMVLSHQRLSCEGAALASSAASVASRWLGPDGALPGAAEALAPTLQRTLAQGPLIRAWVVDRAGRVAACADTTGQGCPAGAPGQPGPAEAPLDVLVSLMHPSPLEASAPVVRNGELAGAVRISYPPDEVTAQAGHLARSAAVVAGIWILLGMLFGTVLVRHVTRPLTEVVRAAEKLPEGERIEVKVRADPELTELVKAFNRMSARLRESRREMEELIASLNERVARATDEGLRAERLVTLGAIAAGLAHEMGNSLHVIAGFTSVVLRELPPGHANRVDLEAVQRESQRAAALLERFLFFARARSARVASQSVEPVLREAVQVVGPAAAEARVAIDVAIEADLPAVRVDPELLRQAFLNLCVNAVQAMEPAGGRLRVRARRRDDAVEVEFEDSGPGVDPAIQERIFEPFFTTKPNGTGLGLAIVRQAAEAHGGAVEVRSGPGKGALFVVRLPAHQGTAA